MEKLLKIPKWVCDIYLNELAFISVMPSTNIGLEDGEVSNHLYESKRSNMQYCYLVSHLVLFINACIVWYVRWKTGIRLDADINKRCAPIFTYGEGGDCKAHRDRDMLNGKANFPEYVAVLCLHDGYTDANLRVNDSPHNQVSDDGKHVRVDEYVWESYHLGKGDLLIFNNRNSVHGVTEVITGQRITTGFRSL